MWRHWFEHPERVWLRSVIFQLHLWGGAAAGLYIVLMSVTGSLIVFRNPLERVPALIPTVEWIVNLHENLLLGETGRFVNGVGAIGLVLLSLTGAVIWWPGIANWRRALRVNWRSLFARFSWDLHSALGFWGFLFVLMWGVSGAYLAFPNAFNTLFRVINPHDRFTDQALYWLSLLHFGRFDWLTEGIWALVGLLPALLSLTGIFLCCRRVILKAPSPKPF